jgi:hypothetical protein
MRPLFILVLYGKTNAKSSFVFVKGIPLKAIKIYSYLPELFGGATEMDRHNFWKWIDNTNRKWVDSSNRNGSTKHAFFCQNWKWINTFFCSLEMV